MGNWLAHIKDRNQLFSVNALFSLLILEILTLWFFDFTFIKR